MKITVEEVVKAVNGKLIGVRDEEREVINGLQVEDICMNSLEAKDGDIFVPIVGSNLDAHQFIDPAMDKLKVTFTDRELDGYRQGRAYIKVDNTIKALQMLGGHVRSRYDKKVIAVTGSVGKTTTREMITTALSSAFDVYHTEKNYNSETGAPVTLFKMLDRPSDIAVLELGISNFGEMDDLAEIARPDIAVVTIIGDAHREFFKTRENTRDEKLKVISRMDKNGVVFLNGDDPLLAEMKDRLPVNVFFYGTLENADYRAVNIEQDDKGTSFDILHDDMKYSVRIPVFGKHNVLDATAAIAVTDYLGKDVMAAIEKLKFFEGQRQKIYKADKNGYNVIDDTYNASPDSMKAALDVLKGYDTSGRRVAVLGDMFELGSETEALHSGVGRCIRDYNVDILVTVGKLSRRINEAAGEGNGLEKHHFETNDEAASYLKDNLLDGDTVMLKASNGMHFKEIVSKIVKEA
ncbi:MAG: UDP-N-acetylmuramoyl-tripeptide--D-alanyl-D-alanine ligase [Eubacterium sp.]|nr:UDP-N-acetylmuramoyl-tripeptide--D-alanyl-D-alanine ligase [Eubacterium sp.]